MVQPDRETAEQPLSLLPLPPTDAASKHATQAFFDCLRAEVAEYNIKVTVVSPAYIQTNLSLNAITADGSPYGGEALCTCLLGPGCTKFPVK